MLIRFQDLKNRKPRPCNVSLRVMTSYTSPCGYIYIEDEVAKCKSLRAGSKAI